MREAGFADLGALVERVRAGTAAPGLLYMVGRTSHLAERWTDFAPRLVLAGDQDADPAVREAATSIGAEMGLEVVWESPADVIPLPARWRQRARPAPAAIRWRQGCLDVMHFDPYSVVLRLIARGDESDYVESVEYVTRGWVRLPAARVAGPGGAAAVHRGHPGPGSGRVPPQVPWPAPAGGRRSVELRYASRVAEVAWP